MATKRVLVVDDDPAGRSQLLMYLEALDPSVITRDWGGEVPWRPPMTVKRVLVVDDDPAVRCLLQHYLETLGHVVETAEDGQQALTKLDQTGYDAVVTDYSMPLVNGLGVLKHIQDKYPSVPAVMMTGDKSNRIVTQAMAAGARACLFKPFRPQDLGQVLKWW